MKSFFKNHWMDIVSALLFLLNAALTIQQASIGHIANAIVNLILSYIMLAVLINSLFFDRELRKSRQFMQEVNE